LTECAAPLSERLALSKQTIPHFYLTVSCDLTRLSEIREILNAQAPRDAQNLPVWKLSINDFIIKAMASALKQVPDANVKWADEFIRRHHSCDVGVAVAVEGGLFTTSCTGSRNEKRFRRFRKR
jgi:pyruvate dehydrogenase E2 component (dihydrolipoamide acetyltransferase)